MKSLHTYINEKLVINNNYKIYNYYPNDIDELKNAIKEHYDNNIYDLNDIDVSKITDFDSLFQNDENTGNRDFDVSEWDVSNGENFFCMFGGCKNFNCNLSKWNVSNGEDFYAMFWGCKKFNSDLSNWDIKDGSDTNLMFHGCDIDDKYKPKYFILVI